MSNKSNHALDNSGFSILAYELMEKESAGLDSCESARGKSAAAEEVERMLRLEWWLNHGHGGLYGGNGEMRCPICSADYKRQPLDELEPLVYAARAMSLPVAGVPRNTDFVAVTLHDKGGPLPTLPEGYHPTVAAI